MTIKEIYHKFGTPPNLQEHLIRVTNISLFIGNNWDHQSDLDLERLRLISLLHDIANIVKFDFVKHPEFLGPEQGRIEYWKSVQAVVVAKYGSDDHLATASMLREIGLSEKIISDIQHKSFANALDIEKSADFELKILFYADMRVAPQGVVSLDERLIDVTTRLDKYRLHPQKDQLIFAARHIAAQIQSHLLLDLNQLSDTTPFPVLDLATIQV
jgi:hypothetical protein